MHAEARRAQHAAERASRLQHLQPLAIGDAAADVVYHLPQRKPHRHFVQPRIAHIPVQAHDRRSRAAIDAYGRKPVRALGDNLRDVRQAFDIVDSAGLAPYAKRGGEGRAVARLRPMPLYRLHQRRLFPRHIRLARQRDLYVKVECGIKHILAQ